MGRGKIVGRSASVALIIFGILLIVAGLAFFGAMVVIAERHGATYVPGALPYLLAAAGIGVMSWGVRGWVRLGHVSATKKTKTADNEVRVYQDTDSRSPMVARLAEGTDIELGEAKIVNGLKWIRVRLPDKQQGYILGNCSVYTVLKAVVVDAEAYVYRGPAPQNPPLAKLVAGSEIEVHEAEWDNLTQTPGAQVNVWLPDGQHGYLPRSTKVKWV